MGQWLSDRLGQQFIIENRASAGGNIGAEAVAKAPERKSRPKAALYPVARYCNATGPENVPSVALARTALFPNVSSAPPPEKLKPVPLPAISESLTRTVTLGPSERMPKALLADLVFVTITPIGA
jgi:hypothetical protein